MSFNYKHRVDLEPLMEMIIEHIGINAIIEKLGRDQVIGEIDIEEFIQAKGKSDVLNSFFVDEVCECFDLIKRPEEN